MPITPLEHFLCTKLKLDCKSSLFKEMSNYLSRHNYEPMYKKTVNDEYSNILPMIFAQNDKSQCFIYYDNVRGNYYSIVDYSLDMDEESVMRDYEIKKTITLDDKGFDILINANKGKEYEYEVGLSCFDSFIFGYVIDPDKNYKTLLFNALNSLYEEVADEHLVLYFAMKELEKQFINIVNNNLDMERERKLVL